MLGDDDVLRALARQFRKPVYRFEDEVDLEPDALELILGLLGSNPCPPGCHPKAGHIRATSAVLKNGEVTFSSLDVLRASCFDEEGLPCKKRKWNVYVLDYSRVPPGGIPRNVRGKKKR